MIGIVAWMTSPKLRWTAETFGRDYQLYKEQNLPTSAGLRLEFYRKSLRFISEAPLFGHGTGSIRGLFEEAAVDQRGAAAEGDFKSAQSDAERRHPVGRDRHCRAICDLAGASDAVPRRGPGSLDRIDGRGAEYFHLAVQLSFIRFQRGMDIRPRRRHRRRHGAEEFARSGNAKFLFTVMAGMYVRDEISAASQPPSPTIVCYRSAK